MMSKTAIYWAAGLGVVAVAAVTPAILKFYDIGWPGAAAAPPALSQKAAESGDREAAAPAAPLKAPESAAAEAPAKPAEPAASSAPPVAAPSAAPPPKGEAAASPGGSQPAPGERAASAAAPPSASPPPPAAASAAPAAAPAPSSPAAAGPQQATPSTPTTHATQAAPPAKAEAQRPAFDVVRVEPSGDAVIAGRASPRAAVQLRSDGRVVAQVDADEMGQFAILPPPFPAGDHRLQLAARSGGAEVLSDAIGIQVPATAESARQNAPQSPEKQAASAQNPVEPQHLAEAAAPKAGAPAAPKATPAPEPPKVAALGAEPSKQAASAPLVAILSVETNGVGRFEAKGAAEPNALVRLYLNNAFVAEAKAGADGRWSLTVERGMTPGPYAIRADEIDRANGAVVARAEVPFDYPARPTGEAAAAAAPPAADGAVKPADQTASAKPAEEIAAAPASPQAAEAAPRPAGAEPPRQAQSLAASTPSATPAPAAAPAKQDGANPVVPEIRTTKVVRGDNLWNLSKRFYGYGPRYKVIYQANASQIRNPRLIYPDQIFVVPRNPPQ
ncbi:MAG TPA: LysM peptidoglycan-binding domain-containing protein [Roseiarcus sp.]|nr:LysM peptidoglycan-binding domain-containing protein [Roseiarcus sp.]